MCNVHIPLLCQLFFQFLFHDFKNQPLGFLDLILRLEQEDYYLIFWNYFCLGYALEIFQVLSVGFESI